jgi:hypothetical protein
VRPTTFSPVAFPERRPLTANPAPAASSSPILHFGQEQPPAPKLPFLESLSQGVNRALQLVEIASQPVQLLLNYRGWQDALTETSLMPEGRAVAKTMTAYAQLLQAAFGEACLSFVNTLTLPADKPKEDAPSTPALLRPDKAVLGKLYSRVLAEYPGLVSLQLREKLPGSFDPVERAYFHHNNGKTLTKERLADAREQAGLGKRTALKPEECEAVLIRLGILP